jgi:prepilin-type N-terminal cleavage/methylation domain-containing protein
MMRHRGFTLVELAVVMTIVALLLGSLLYTLSAQSDQRNVDETRRRLDQARELLLSYAVVNGRLPCPARCANWPNCTTTAAETRDAAGNCTSGGTDDYYGGALAGGAMGGLLPALTIGAQNVDASGFAVDAWGNRIRYAVAQTVGVGTCTVAPPAGTRLYTHKDNLKLYGVACQPGDLLVCKSATAATATTCGGAANQIMSTSLVVAIVFSTGKNGMTSPNGAGVDEATNVKTNALLAPLINPVFVSHAPTDNRFANGEFDDQMTWITVGELYGKLIAAGVLP